MPTCMLLQQLQDNIPTHHLGSNNKERSQADSLTYPRQTRLLSVTCLTGSAFLRQQRLLPVDGRGRQIPNNFYAQLLALAAVPSQDL
jgi:hypothetical protein